jgi:hypothetical protein
MCLSWFFLFGDCSLRRIKNICCEHYLFTLSGVLRDVVVHPDFFDLVIIIFIFKYFTSTLIIYFIKKLKLWKKICNHPIDGVNSIMVRFGRFEEEESMGTTLNWSHGCISTKLRRWVRSCQMQAGKEWQWARSTRTS